jgi:nucleoside-diphosphate-sugar epimerase
MEYVAALYSNKLPLVITRPFNYTGRGQNVEFLIPKIVDHLRRGAPVIELGNLEVARDFSDVRTVVDAYARLLQTPAAIGGTYNICSGRAVTLREVLALAEQVSGHSIGVEVNTAFVRSNEVKRLLGSSARLESVIGGLKHIALEDTLRWMFAA